MLAILGIWRIARSWNFIELESIKEYKNGRITGLIALIVILVFSCGEYKEDHIDIDDDDDNNNNTILNLIIIHHTSCDMRFFEFRDDGG